MVIDALSMETAGNVKNFKDPSVTTSSTLTIKQNTE